MFKTIFWNVNFNHSFSLNAFSSPQLLWAHFRSCPLKTFFRSYCKITLCFSVYLQSDSTRGSLYSWCWRKRTAKEFQRWCHQRETVGLFVMRWSCKKCSFRTSKRLALLKHYQLKHLHSGKCQSLPCLYSDCPCTFKRWGALRSHLSRDHYRTEKVGQIVSFLCLVCNSCSFHTERQYFEHLGAHLKKTWNSSLGV